MSPSRRAILLVLIAIPGATLIFASAGSNASYDLVATYIIDDTAGAIAYEQQGALTQVMICSGEWQLQTPTVQATSDARHKEVIKVGKIPAKYVVERQENFVITTTESICVGVVTTSSPPGCSFEYTWFPSQAVGQHSPLQPGWSDMAALEGTAIGPASADVFHIQDADLRVERVFPTYGPSSVPFTGRYQFQDPTTGDLIRSPSYIAGVCLGDHASTTTPCCHFQPTTHEVRFSVRATSGAPLEPSPVGPPPVGPLGVWRQWLTACNEQCS